MRWALEVGLLCAAGVLVWLLAGSGGTFGDLLAVALTIGVAAYVWHADTYPLDKPKRRNKQ